MNVYPQLLLWTYVLLPAISLLLTPTFIIALARAQQQRSKVMINALNARGRAAAAMARNHQRRYIPNNRYLNCFGPNKLYKLRTKREMDLGELIPPLIVNPNEPDAFERKSNWDQQEESLGQLQNMWNMNNFGNSQSDDVIRSMQDQTEKVMEDIVGDPFIYNHKNQKNDGKSDYYSGAFSGRNVFDEVLEQKEPFALIQNENGAQFIEDRAADPEPTLKKKKKKFGIKQEPYPQSYYNSYYPQHSYSNAYYRSADLEATSPNEPIEAGEMERISNGSPLNDERLGNPEPTLKKLKKKLNKKQEPYPQNYYNSYYPQHSYSNTYYRSADPEGTSQNIPIEADKMERIANGDLPNDEKLGNAEPTLKKLKKKLNKKQEPYPQNYYNSYYPQHTYPNTYYRSADLEGTTQNIPIEAGDMERTINGDLPNDEKLGNPEPTLKKLKKKLNKKQEPYPQNYYNSYYPQYSHVTSYYPYRRSEEDENIPLGEPFRTEMTGLSTGDPTNTDERLGSPEPTFKKLKKKKLGNEHEPYSYPPSYYNSYYPQYTPSNAYYNPYSRSAEIEDVSQNPPVALINEDRLSLKMTPKSADPDPTFKNKKSKFVTEPHMAYGYSHPQNDYNSYSNFHYSPYSRETEAEKMHQNIQEHEMDNFMISELVAPRFANPEPTFKKKKSKKIEHMPPSFYYPPKPYYPQDQYITYYPSNPYYRNAETAILGHNVQMKRSAVNSKKVGEETPFKEEQKSANPEPHHNHHIKMENKNKDLENFFYSSNFYERENGGVEDSNEPNILKTEVKSDPPVLINEEKPAENNHKVTEEPQNSDDISNKNSPQTSGNDQNAKENLEEVGCELDEKIEEKLQKKLKKLLKTDDKKDEKHIDYPYPPMYPPSNNYGSEYAQPEYYRSASETDRIDEPIKDEGEEQKSSKAPFAEPVMKLEADLVPKDDLEKKLLPLEEKIDALSQQNAKFRAPTTTNTFTQNMVNSHSSLATDQTHIQPEQVGCELDDKLFESGSPSKTFDPYSYYQRAVDGISEEGIKIAVETKKLLNPPEQSPVTPVAPKLTFVDMDEIYKSDHPPREQVSSDSIPISDEYSTSLEEKSANPNADPTLHSRGFTHTHSHFSSHTHGHTHEKNIGTHHGAHNLHSVNPQIAQQGFSQANANAQTFNHGGIQHSVAHSNSNSFGNGFGSNTAQSGVSTFNSGQVNNFGSTGPQIFPTNGFGQSTGSNIQGGGHLSNFGLNHGFAQAEAQAQSGQINGFGSGGGIAQSGSQALNNGGLAQATASAGSITQNGPTFIPNNVVTQPIFNHGGFGQSAAQASAQAGVTGFNGVQNFGNGFQNTQPLIFNNNPGQFASSSANAHVVGQPRESFIMPHLDEIPVHDLLSRMEFDKHRFSRAAQDFSDVNGLELASNIVDASLNENPFLNENSAKRYSEKGKNTQNPMGFVANIVESSLKAGENIAEKDNENENSEKKYSEEGKNTQNQMGFVTNIVESSLKAGENIAQKDNIVKAPSNFGTARHLTLDGIGSITDLVGKGLRLKRQAKIDDNGFQNSQQIILDDNINMTKVNQDVISNTVGDPITNVETVDGKVLGNQSPDSLLQISDKTNKNVDENISTNHNKDMVQAPITMRSENAGIKNKVEEVSTLVMVDPDSFTPTPKIVTSESWTMNGNHKTDEVVTPIAKHMFTKEKVDSQFFGPNSATTTENLIMSVHTEESVNPFSEVENIEKVLMTNPITESYGITVHDNIINNTSTKSYQSVDLEPPNFKEISESVAGESQNHTELNASTIAYQKEDYKENLKKNNYFVGLGFKNLSLNKSSKSSNEEKGRHINLDGNDVMDETANTEIPKEILAQFLFYPNGTKKNISELTSDEITELQFDLPKNSTEIPQSEHKDLTTEVPTLGQALQNNKNLTVEQKNNPKELMQQGDSSNVSDTTYDRIQKDLIKKLMTNMSDGPFASIEAEMGILTEEEKEAFIKQEVHLIAQVVEETLRHINNEGAITQEQITLKDNRKGIQTETKETGSVVASPNIFQAIGRENNPEEYSRQASGKTLKEETFDTLLGQQREKVEKIKNVADKDEDLLMISFIGDSVIKDLENRRTNNNQLNQTPFKQLNKTMDDTILINPDNRVDVSDALKPAASTNQSNEQSKINESSSVKTKREIGGLRASRAPLTQLITDPTMKLNVEKTLQNLGSIARHTFENPKAPMYHVRNMLGNAKNSVMSVAKVPPNNFLIPSQYEIAKISRNNNQNDERVGSVNQKMLLSRSGFENTQEEEVGEPESYPSEANENFDNFGLEDTVQKIGGMVKDSVQTGKDALKHVNDVAIDAKKILHTSKYATPRFVRRHPSPMLTSRGAFPPDAYPFKYSPYTPHLKKKTLEPVLGASVPKKSITAKPNRNTVMIAPKIFDIQENIVGEPQEHPDSFLGMGHILDAAGFSQPNQPEVELQKIEFVPLNNMNLKPFTKAKKYSRLPKKSMPTSTSIPSPKDDLTTEPNKNAILGASQVNNAAPTGSVQDGEHKTDPESLQDFMQRMHNEMKEIVRLQYEERKRTRMERMKNPKTNPYYKNQNDLKNYNKNYKKTARQTLKSMGIPNEMASPILRNIQSFYNLRNNNDGNVQILPSELTNIFSKTPLSALNKNLPKKNNKEDMMVMGVPTFDSRIKQSPLNMDISLPVTNYAEKYPYQARHLKNKKYSDSDDDKEKVGLLLPENLMKPFMGQPSETLMEDYMRANGDEEVLERESFDKSKKNTKLSESSIPKIQPISALNINSLAPKSFNFKKPAMSPQLPLTPLDLQFQEINPLLSPNPTPASTLNSEIIGASVSEKIVNKTGATNSSEIEEKTKELVELLSDPEIDDSETTTSSSLDSIAKEKNVVKPSSVVKQSNNEPLAQNIIEHTSTENNANIQTIPSSSLDFNVKGKEAVKPSLVVYNHNTELHPQSSSVYSSTEKSPTIPSGIEESITPSTIKYDNTEEPKNINLIDNVNQTPTSNFKRNPMMMGHVPDENDLGYVLGAINPMMFERHFNERLKINDTSSKDTHNQFLKHGVIKEGHPGAGENESQNEDKEPEALGMTNGQDSNENLNENEDVVEPKYSILEESDEQMEETDGQGRTSMKVLDPYKKPFMGYIKKDKMHKFLNKYNNNLPEEHADEQQEEYHTQYDNRHENTNPVYSSLDDEEEYENYGY